MVLRGPQKCGDPPKVAAGRGVTPRLTASARAEMTLPRVVRDLLMLAPSWGREKGKKRLRRGLGGVTPFFFGVQGGQCPP